MAIDKSQMTQYTDGKVTREAKDMASFRGNFQWWMSDEKDIANDIAGTVKFIRDHQTARYEQLLAATRLYGNSNFYNLLGTGTSRLSSNMSTPGASRIGYNLIQSIVDTKVSKIAKNKVIPVFITNGGDWDIQQKAQKLSKFVEGCFYENKSHQKGMITYKHAEVWGTGISHIYARNNKVCEEVAYPHEFFIDEVESLTTFPRQLFRVKIVDRSCVLAWYPDEKEKIMKSSNVNYEEIGAQATAADLVALIEAWHLPSDPEADDKETDGRHALIIGDQYLCSDPYTKDFYPFAFLTPTRRLLGFWGQGTPERQQSKQSEINRLMILIQRSMWMGGSFKVLVENGSKVVSQHLNNDVGAIIYYSGTQPQYVTPPMIQQDIYPYVDSLIAKGYQDEGVSQLQASSLKPPGLDSGKALRAYIDSADDRMMLTEQEVEQYYLDKAALMIDTARDIYKEKKSYKVMFPTTTFVETIDWKDIQLDKDEYVLKAFPTSSLRDDYSGRLQDIQESMQAGLISPRTGRKLMQMPDIEMADSLANAPEDLIHKQIENLLEGKEYKYNAPEPTQDLALAKELALDYMNYAKFHNCPQDRINNLQLYLDQVNEYMGVIPQTPQLNPVGAPQANPAPAPVSNMIPNVPQVA